jgi:hypothetical protein
MVALAVVAPVFSAWVPKARTSFNQGLASLQPADLRIVAEPFVRNRKAWALRMASPEDGGKALGATLGVPLETPTNPVPDLTKFPDPLYGMPAAPETEAKASRAKKP